MEGRREGGRSTGVGASGLRNTFGHRPLDRRILVPALVALLSVGLALVGTAAPSRGAITIAIGVPIDTMNGPLISSTVVVGATRHVVQGLFRMGRMKTVEPELAESYTVSPDGRTWTLKLRRGVKFHDGTPFNAEAVVANFRHLFDKKLAYSRAILLNMISTWRAVDPDTIELRLSRPFGALPAHLTYQSALIYSPAALAKYGPEGIGRNPVGTGPFRVQEYVPGQRLVMVKDADYWGPVPKLERITWVTIREEGARVAALQAGEVNAAIPVTPKFRRSIDERSGIAFKVDPGSRLLYIAINTHFPSLKDVRVREAMSLGIKRQQIVDAFVPGVARLPTSVFASGAFGHTPVYRYEYNPEKAKQLLAQAGWTRGPSGKLVDAQGTAFPRLTMIAFRGRVAGDLEAGQAVLAQLTDLGFDIQFRELEFTALIAEMRDEAANRTSQPRTHLAMFSLGNSLGDGSFSLDFYDDRSKVNWAVLYYDGDVAWGDIDTAWREADPEKRMAALASAQRKLAAEHFFLPLYEAKQTYAIDTRLRGVWSLPSETYWFGDAWIQE